MTGKFLLPLTVEATVIVVRDDELLCYLDPPIRMAFNSFLVGSQGLLNGSTLTQQY